MSKTADRNLEEEEPEDEMTRMNEIKANCAVISTLVKRPRKRTDETCSGMKILKLLMVFCSICTLAEPQTTFHICSKSQAGGIMVSIPDPTNCCVSESDTVLHTKVTIYTRSYAKIPAIYCANFTRTICTKAFFRPIMKVISDEIEVGALSPSVCQKLNSDKEYAGTRLQQILPSHWKSRNDVHYSDGWLGTRCTTTTNYVLEYGDIATSEDHGIISSLGDMGNCKVLTGLCMTRKGTIMWNATEVREKCFYESKGTTIAQATVHHVLIESLQAALIFAKGKISTHTVLHCNLKNPQKMENDIILTFEEVSTNLSIPEWIVSHKEEVDRMNFRNTNWKPLDPIMKGYDAARATWAIADPYVID
ncbi:unnamed protein product, partial [Gongylonema pulchrum]|uniref:RNase H domain-containing protein n=1 Tax=Gongylonema pulchrum TaxID=637853 RepID=A0A183F0D7_9BILA